MHANRTGSFEDSRTSGPGMSARYLRCARHRHTVTDSAGSVTAEVREVTVHGLPVPAWRADVSISSPAASSAMTSVEIGIGYNLVILNQATDFTGPFAQPDEAVIDAAVHALTPASPAPPTAAPGPAAVQILTQAAASHITAAVDSSL